MAAKFKLITIELIKYLAAVLVGVLFAWAIWVAFIYYIFEPEKTRIVLAAALIIGALIWLKRRRAL